MTLRKAKVLFCVIVILVSLVLANSGFAGWLMAVLLLSGALPWWKAATHAMIDQSLDDAESALVAERQKREARRIAGDRRAAHE